MSAGIIPAGGVTAMSTNGSQDRLDSWKAIASFLGRTERTARRWERHEGLPIHRLSHHDRSSVYAFKSELDSWRAARSTETNGEADSARGSSRRPGFPLVASLVAVVAALGGYLWWRASDPPAAGVPTLAVLPFVIESTDTETAHLGAAVAESLVNHMAGAPDLRVRPFVSSLRNFRPEVEPATIGERMDVDMIVAGEVSARGNGLTIKVTLVDVEPNTQIWGSSFTTTYGELGPLQPVIARTLWEQALRHRHGAKYSLPVLDTVERLSTNPEAVRHYLRGLGLQHSTSRPQIQYSIDQFHSAVELDPDFAAAHSALSVAYVNLSFFGDSPIVETMTQAKAHALKAIALDPRSADGHRALAAASHWYDFDHELADQQFRVAITAAPYHAGLRIWYAEFLINMGRFDEALGASRTAAELDPRWAATDVVSGIAFVSGGHPKEAELICRNALGIDPNYATAHYCIAHAYLATDRHAEAVAELELANHDIGGAPFSMASLAYGLGRAGRRAEAEEMLRGFERLRKTGYYPAFTLAMAHAGLGDDEQALDWLERAADERLLGYYLPSVEPAWDALRGHPRFKRLLQRLGLPDSRA